ncbi:FAS1-like dehydratase domain-containing protein [Diaminobutyricibacter sp. McL0618]|uniref:FAS1-like dehydratase domain-containing protein n=1 Tax=Leifsonia sp. McL0618 TaxID=3415677 RepID=UPI003CF6B891
MTGAPAADYGTWVGRTEVVDDVASRSSVAQLAALLDRPIAAEHLDATPLFPTGHWMQFTPTAAESELGADGHPRLGGFMPPLDLPRRMWAGSTIEYHAPIMPGQRLRKTSTIESITPKTGSSGRLCFVVLRHDIDAGGRPAITERQTVVYREPVERATAMPTGPQPPREATDAPDGWDWTSTATPDEIILFRFSALTFNSHRIHYDLPYASDVEGYPGLVVHGPLSATMLVSSFLDRRPGATITHFEFTARTPVFARERLHIVGRSDGQNAEELAVIAPEGQTAVAARIRYH